MAFIATKLRPTEQRSYDDWSNSVTAKASIRQLFQWFPNSKKQKEDTV
ncbi:hypothetical protein [Prevotella intermedia]|nr:hypothetical protein [Prevotella intermedia]